MERKRAWYSFGAFRLCPEDRVLQRRDDGRTVKLSGRPFDILAAIVTAQPPNSLVLKSDLLDKIWTNGAVEEGNLATGMSSVRRALGDNTGAPKYVQTVRSHGYRLIPSVTIEKPAVAREGPAPAVDRGAFCATIHRFVPVYLGTGCDGGKLIPTRWGEYRELFTASHRRLCIVPCGVGVWHEQEGLSFDSILDFAVARRRKYVEILRTPCALAEATASLIAQTNRRRSDLKTLEQYVGKFPYVLSVVDVHAHSWTHSETPAALKLIASPRVLCPDDVDDPVTLAAKRSMERDLLSRGFDHADLREFGLHHQRVGYASWAGVSLFDPNPTAPSLTSTLVEFEIALQALWALSHSIGDALSAVHAHAGALAEFVPTLRRGVSRLAAVGPTDSVELRTMLEAVLFTSRLEKQLVETLKLLNA